MKILAIDSAAAGCNVCVWEDGNVLSVKTEQMMRGQDARLVPLIEEVVEEASITYEDLDMVAVIRGPGSFTGLRVGLATARGIGLASEKPVVGIDRFSIYKDLFVDDPRPLLVAIESRRLELFVTLFEEREEGSYDPETATMLPPEEIVELAQQHPTAIIVGDAQAPLSKYFDKSRFINPKEPEVIACARLAAIATIGEPRFLPRPLYLRAPDVCLPKNKNA